MAQRTDRLDTDFVRAQFPAFSQPRLKGQAFFENAGGSYTCGQVIERLMRYYTERKVQPYASYAASRLAGEEMDEARARLAAIFNVDTEELSFGPSTTQNTYVLAQAFAEHLVPGDAIIVTNQDHEANSGPWRRLAERGIEIREWQIDADTGHLGRAALAPLLADGRVKLVCFPHCSNVIAEINPVAEICAAIRDAGAVSCVDGVSYAPHGLPDVTALGADIYLCSAYKVYGPHQGLMVIRRALAERLPNQGHYFNADSLYKRFTPAGPDHAQIASCAGIADYFDTLYDHHFGTHLGVDAAQRARAVCGLMRDHETRIQQPLLDYLGQKNTVRVIGPKHADQRAPTVALSLTGRDPGQVAADLAGHGIMAAGGDFYAVRPLEALGIDPDHGVLRLSFVHYTREGDIVHLIDALERVL